MLVVYLALIVRAGQETSLGAGRTELSTEAGAGVTTDQGPGGRAGHTEGGDLSHTPNRGRGTGVHTAAGQRRTCHTAHPMLVPPQRLTSDMGQARLGNTGGRRGGHMTSPRDS